MHGLSTPTAVAVVDVPRYPRVFSARKTRDSTRKVQIGQETLTPAISGTRLGQDPRKRAGVRVARKSIMNGGPAGKPYCADDDDANIVSHEALNCSSQITCISFCFFFVRRPSTLFARHQLDCTVYHVRRMFYVSSSANFHRRVARQFDHRTRSVTECRTNPS